MDSVAENIGGVVALLTAILSEQEDLAYAMVIEKDPIELFSAITGVLLSVLYRLSVFSGITPESYLQELGMIASKSE